jgi:hypothetical protein
MVVFNAPILDHHPGFGQCPELLPLKAFFPQAAVEAFNEPVLPRTARIDVERADAGIMQPLLPRRKR